MIHPQEKEQSNSMGEYIIDAFKETSLNLLLENLDKYQVQHIASALLMKNGKK